MGYFFKSLEFFNLIAIKAIDDSEILEGNGKIFKYFDFL